MTNYAYKKDIPAANHNPSVDQPDMKDNTNAIANLIGEDHYTFGVSNGGFHKQIRLPKLNTTADLSPRISNSGTLWTQVNTSTGASTETNLHYIPGTGANDYQLTRCIAGSFSLFGTNSVYQPANPVLFKPSTTGGWTFLPGGMLMQYGISTNANLATNNVVDFPVPFKTFVGSIVITPVRTNTDDKVVAIENGSISLTGFKFSLSSSSRPTSITWMAIGV
jgi:hypothetical protein